MSEPQGTSVALLSAQITEIGAFMRQATAIATAQRDRTEMRVATLSESFEEMRVQFNNLALRVESVEGVLTRRVEHLEQREMVAPQIPAAQTNVNIGSHNQETAKPVDEPAKPAKWKTYLLLLVTGAAGASGGASLSTPSPEAGMKVATWAQTFIDAWRSIKGG
jgi:hypothetical protein